MENTKNIYQRMSAITNELNTVAKNLNISVGKGSYKAVGEADVLAEVKPMEEKHGVYSYPCARSVIESGILENADYNGNVKKQLWERIETIYRFVNIDNPSEFIEITTYGDGIDSGDKSVGKAMTYADKYALLKAYKIITGDDPDQEASGELRGVSIKKDTPKKSVLSDETQSLVKQYNVDLVEFAKYKRVGLNELTDELVREGIELKKKNLEKLGVK